MLDAMRCLWAETIFAWVSESIFVVVVGKIGTMPLAIELYCPIGVLYTKERCESNILGGKSSKVRSG